MGSKRIDIYPAPIVEGMLAAVLAQVKGSLDIVYENPRSMKLVDNVKACYTITRHEVAVAVDRLRVYSDKSLNRKHRACREILVDMLSRLEKNDVEAAKRMHNKKVVRFGRDVVDFLSVFHIALAEGSTEEARESAAAAFTGKVVDAEPVS